MWLCHRMSSRHRARLHLRCSARRWPIRGDAGVFLLVVMTVAGAPSRRPSRRFGHPALTLLTSAGYISGSHWRAPSSAHQPRFFAVNVYTRFYEYFWDAMPKSLFFMVGGAALILGGVWVERMRRRVVRQFATASA